MAAVLQPTHPTAVPQGGGFLFQEAGTDAHHHAGDLHRGAAAAVPHRAPVLPRAGPSRRPTRSRRRRRACSARCSGRPASSGCLMVDVPERFGGLGGDKTTSLLLAEANGLMGSWSVTFAAHVGIGTLPIAWFGTEAQKAKWLPKLATGELVGGLRADRAGQRERRARGEDQGGEEPRRQVVDPEREQALHHQRRLRRPVRGLRQGGRRALHRLRGGEGRRPGSPWGPRSTRWASAAPPPARCTSRTRASRSRTSSGRSARATRSPSTS